MKSKTAATNLEVSPGEFATLMAHFAPFEERPRLAVAVSGGADSLALCLLADAWARKRGGVVSALIVDHGLRAESAAEAKRVNAWLAGRGIETHVLPWIGPKPTSAVQARARAARYALLDDWCRDAGVLHLLLGHHADDQNETVALRRVQGSGADGLAGMSAIVESDATRRLRPLLTVPKTRLRATLTALGQAWIEDPSNRDLRFARARLREVGHADRPEPAAIRIDAENEVARWLAGNVLLFPTGHARLRANALTNIDPEIAGRALGRVIAWVGGKPHPPRRAVLDRLCAMARGDGPTRARTAGNCALHAGRGGWLAVARENRNLPVPRLLDGPGEFLWDGRFHIRVKAPPTQEWTLAPLGTEAARHYANQLKNNEITAQVAATLPALWRGVDFSVIVRLGSGDDGPVGLGLEWAEAHFHPRNPLGPVGFFLPSGENHLYP